MAEVIVIGGGPAGFATAIALAQSGITVSLIEQKSFPIDKPCGEGIMPEGVARLQELGVFDHLDRTNASPFHGVCLINENGVRAFSHFSNSHGLGCRRTALSNALHARARELSNLSIISSTVAGIEQTSESVSVKLKDRLIHARLVIGADGLRSMIRKWAGLENGGRRYLRYGLRKHFAISPWSRFVEVYFKRGIEAYITPCGFDQTNITFLWHKTLMRQCNEKVSFDYLLGYFPEIAHRLADKQCLSTTMSIGPLHQRCEKVIADGVCLVGDASGYLDAVTGEGISIALAQAVALVPTVAKALTRSSKGIIKEDELISYAKRHRQILKPYYRTTSVMLWLAQHPRLITNVIRLGAAKPNAFSWVMEGFRSRRLRFI